MSITNTVFIGETEGIIDGLEVSLKDLYEEGEEGAPCQVLTIILTTKFDEAIYGGPSAALRAGAVTIIHAERLFPALDAAREAYARRNEPPENGGPVTLSAEEAEELGFTVDRCCYPWFAYKGPRFDPTDTIPIVTPESR